MSIQFPPIAKDDSTTNNNNNSGSSGNIGSAGSRSTSNTPMPTTTTTTKMKVIAPHRVVLNATFESELALVVAPESVDLLTSIVDAYVPCEQRTAKPNSCLLSIC